MMAPDMGIGIDRIGRRRATGQTGHHARLLPNTTGILHTDRISQHRTLSEYMAFVLVQP